MNMKIHSCRSAFWFIAGVTCLLGVNLLIPMPAAAEEVRIGMNYPRTGPYAVQGKDQWRAARMAAEEINAQGGILGRPIKLIPRDSQSRTDTTYRNVKELIEKENVQMIFGGSASSVAITAAGLCQDKGVLFFGTLTYSNATTGESGHRYSFRECYSAWMGAKAIASYLNSHFAGRKYFYITADYTWGWTTEASVRRFSNTRDTGVHKGMRTPFPDATEAHFSRALRFAKMIKPDVLVLVLFGKDMVTAIRLATAMGLKNDIQIVVPNLTLGMAEEAGPKVMEGVVGALPWSWRVPYQFNYPSGKAFVEAFADRFGRYPSTSGASAYTILNEYRSAVERAGTFDAPAVIKALEGHDYTLLKDKQHWRDFDHQSVQTVYAVRGNPLTTVLRDKYKLDYFQILSALPGDIAARTREEWEVVRTAAGKPNHLEPLPGE